MKFKWEGDLNDDCSCKVGKFLATCECLCDFRCYDPELKGITDEWNSQDWFLGVYHDSEELFSTANHGGMITSGEMARALGEAIIRGYFEA